MEYERGKWAGETKTGYMAAQLECREGDFAISDRAVRPAALKGIYLLPPVVLGAGRGSRG